jgi:hypothetical protein
VLDLLGACREVTGGATTGQDMPLAADLAARKARARAMSAATELAAVMAPDTAQAPTMRAANNASASTDQPEGAVA